MIIKKIASDILLPIEYIKLVSVTANHRYKTYKIKKRTKGYRIINHPARELKLLQRWLVDNLFSDLPVHEAVYSYRTGRNIQGNAALHRRNNFLLRVDFKDFFPSIRAIDVVKMLHNNQSFLSYQLSRNDLSLIASIVCKDGGLTIGAPSSPVISNAILFMFDKQLTDICKTYSVIYSRYADDLYFSTNSPNVLEKLLEDVKLEISKMHNPTLHINHDKSVFTSRKRQRKIAGVTLTSENKLSIGRQRKREIKALIHKLTCGKLSQDKASYLKGLIAYVHSIEPSFIDSLKKKYGEDAMLGIQGIKCSSRKKEH